MISPTGGIRPADRKRVSRALSLAEREEISRGQSVTEPSRAIARRLGRAPSTISREIRPMAALHGVGRPRPIGRHGTVPCAPSWLARYHWYTQYRPSYAAKSVLRS
ncbi:helix-turn-helix domain-containing protein [Novosphingobium sp. BL-8H]|uniref:helix-turn-helix domain-containing protein n=1 Tax=Novosphingobium sp. BL-8H TaxID=3127640 RepID=UPI0037574E96